MPVSSSLESATVKDIPVRPGEKYYFAADVATGGSHPRDVQFTLGAWFYDLNGAYLSYSASSLSKSDIPYEEFGTVISVPSDAALMQVGVRRVAGGTGIGFFSNVRLFKQSGSVLIENGAVTADKIAANSITAQNGAIANLAVQTIKIGNDAVTRHVHSYVTSGTSFQGDGWTELCSVSITSRGGPLTIIATTLPRARGISGNVVDVDFHFRIKRNSTVILETGTEPISIPSVQFGTWSAISVAFSKVDEPSAGTYTYRFEVDVPNGSIRNAMARLRNIIVLERLK